MQPMSSADVDQCLGNRRMDVKVLVRIDVIERQTGCFKSVELRCDFGSKLAPHPRAKEDRGAQPRHVATKASLGIDQPRHLLGWQRRSAIDEHEVQTDAKRRQPPGAPNRIGRR